MGYLKSIFLLVALNSILFYQAPDTMWTKTLEREEGNSVKQTEDNGYIVCGMWNSIYYWWRPMVINYGLISVMETIC